MNQALRDDLQNFSRRETQMFHVSIVRIVSFVSFTAIFTRLDPLRGFFGTKTILDFQPKIISANHPTQQTALHLSRFRFAACRLSDMAHINFGTGQTRTYLDHHDAVLCDHTQ
jgi:hypothetical protein